MPIHPLQRPARQTPLIVDLDGSLLKTDTLYECLAALLRREPVLAFKALGTLFAHGRARMKAEMASFDAIDVETLPLREEFVTWLRQQGANGRELHLVSASDQSIVEKVGSRLGIFASCIGSDGTTNLKGRDKAAYLAKVFPDGFAYAGDSAADLAVWRSAQSVILVNASSLVRRRAAGLNKPVEAQFPGRTNFGKAIAAQLRPHQWSKNLLVFLPILMAHHFRDVQAWSHTALAFVALCLAASATYIVNDIFDLQADRSHATKRNRPIASGALPIAFALLLAPVMLAAAFAFAVAASPYAGFVLAAYLVLTLSYSFGLKRVPLLDTAIIGLLFTLRIVMGNAAAEIAPSAWLLAFSLLLFFSLAMAKRQTEITKSGRLPEVERIAGRGYNPGDVVLSLTYGVSSGVASLVILMLYTTNSVAAGLYRHPEWLWALPLVLYLWQMRIWLLAHRGELHDDPIVFALKDGLSLALGACCAVLFYLAL
jgi:4-hydroxybenzoate polyprenyltransferase/phosphoserine phosphatase